jgi:hypothetical protein
MRKTGDCVGGLRGWKGVGAPNEAPLAQCSAVWGLRSSGDTTGSAGVAGELYRLAGQQSVPGEQFDHVVIGWVYRERQRERGVPERKLHPAGARVPCDGGNRGGHVSGGYDLQLLASKNPPSLPPPALTDCSSIKILNNSLHYAIGKSRIFNPGEASPKAYWMLMRAVFEVVSSTETTTSTSPEPRSEIGSGTKSWSIPANALLSSRALIA